MRGRVLIVLLAVSAAVPSAAQAATVSQPYLYTQTIGPDEKGRTYHLPTYELRFEAAPGEVNDVVFTEGSQRTRSVIVRDSGVPLEPGTNCTRIDGGVECAPPSGGYPGGIKADLGDGDDKVRAGDLLGITVHGGPGADDLSVDAASSRLDGGPGPDRLHGDFVTYTDRTAPVNVSLDGVANDGETGEGDEVSANVVRTGAGDDTLTADAKRVQFDAGAGDDAVTGGPNDDILTGGPGRDSVDAGAGRDFLSVDSDPDVVDGGPGEDRLSITSKKAARVTLDPRFGDSTYTRGTGVDELSGGDGSDTMIGSNASEQIETYGGGHDTILGLGGDDRIFTLNRGGNYIDPGSGRDSVSSGHRGDQIYLRDGEKDTLGCQPMSERRVVDRDRADSVYCERFSFFRGVRHLRAGRGGTVEVPLTCPRAESCAGTLALRWRGRTIKTLAFTRKPGSRSSVRFKLGTVARHELERGRPLRLTVALEVVLHREPAAPHSASRRITVLPPRH